MFGPKWRIRYLNSDGSVFSTSKPMHAIQLLGALRIEAWPRHRVRILKVGK